MGGGGREGDPVQQTNVRLHMGTLPSVVMSKHEKWEVLDAEHAFSKHNNMCKRFSLQLTSNFFRYRRGSAPSWDLLSKWMTLVYLEIEALQPFSTTYYLNKPRPCANLALGWQHHHKPNSLSFLRWGLNNYPTTKHQQHDNKTTTTTFQQRQIAPHLPSPLLKL